MFYFFTTKSEVVSTDSSEYAIFCLVCLLTSQSSEIKKKNISCINRAYVYFNPKVDLQN